MEEVKFIKAVVEVDVKEVTRLLQPPHENDEKPHDLEKIYFSDITSLLECKQDNQPILITAIKNFIAAKPTDHPKHIALLQVLSECDYYENASIIEDAITTLLTYHQTLVSHSSLEINVKTLINQFKKQLWQIEKKHLCREFLRGDFVCGSTESISESDISTFFTSTHYKNLTHHDIFQTLLETIKLVQAKTKLNFRAEVPQKLFADEIHRVSAAPFTAMQRTQLLKVVLQEPVGTFMLNRNFFGSQDEKNFSEEFNCLLQCLKEIKNVDILFLVSFTTIELKKILAVLPKNLICQELLVQLQLTDKVDQEHYQAITDFIGQVSFKRITLIDVTANSKIYPFIIRGLLQNEKTFRFELRNDWRFKEFTPPYNSVSPYYLMVRLCEALVKWNRDKAIKNNASEVEKNKSLKQKRFEEQLKKYLDLEKVICDQKISPTAGPDSTLRLLTNALPEKVRPEFKMEISQNEKIIRISAARIYLETLEACFLKAITFFGIKAMLPEDFFILDKANPNNAMLQFPKIAYAVMTLSYGRSCFESIVEENFPKLIKEKLQLPEAKVHIPEGNTHTLFAAPVVGMPVSSGVSSQGDQCIADAAPSIQYG